MSDLLTSPSAAGCETLRTRAAQMAREVAAVVERFGASITEGLETAQFLRDWAESVDTDYAFGPQPLDHLAHRFGLSQLECDVLVLAGLPEMHEGIAASFRATNPNDEPWPTVGIAAVVLEERADRSAIIDMLCAGPLTRYGLVQLSGKGPRFEDRKSVV